MNNIGKYQFTEDSKMKVERLAELTNEDESFIKDTLMYISLKTFNVVLNKANPDVIQKIKEYADSPEMLESYFRSQVSEDAVKEAYTSIHNEYIEDFVTNCGGNYTQEVITEIESLKI